MLKNHKFGKNRKGTTLVFVKISYKSIKMPINHKFSTNRKGTTLVLLKYLINQGSTLTFTNTKTQGTQPESSEIS